MMTPLVSPSLVVRRDVLRYAAQDAVRFGTTVREVIDSFFAGKARPGLAQVLDRSYAVAGIPPHETMELVARFYDPEEIEPADLAAVLEAYTDRMPSPPQARELVEAAQRLARRARIHERQVKAAQAVHDAALAQTETTPPEYPQYAARRAVRAHAVQRYGGPS